MNPEKSEEEIAWNQYMQKCREMAGSPKFEEVVEYVGMLAEAGDTEAANDLFNYTGIWVWANIDKLKDMPKPMLLYLMKGLFKTSTDGDANKAFGLKKGAHRPLKPGKIDIAYAAVIAHRKAGRLRGNRSGQIGAFDGVAEVLGISESEVERVWKKHHKTIEDYLEFVISD